MRAGILPPWSAMVRVRRSRLALLAGALIAAVAVVLVLRARGRLPGDLPVLPTPPGATPGQPIAAPSASAPRARERVGERFDPAKALAATGRYLALARRRLGRQDLAFVSYHMGIGNLESVLRAYGRGRVPYAQLYFDSTPLRHAAAYRRLA